MRADEKVCPQCAETIKLEAKVCKHCGHTFTEQDIIAEKAKRRSGALKVVGIACAAVVGIGVLGAINGHQSTATTNATMNTDDAMMSNDMSAMSNDAAPAMDGSSAPVASPSTGWSYSEHVDKMRGGMSRVAEATSDDTLHLSSPYGDTSPTLTVRQDKKFGFDIYFTSGGQPLCRPFMNGHVSIKFDNGPVRTWGCNEAADGSSGIVFFESARKLLERIKSSKTMTVEDDYYDAGRQVFSFKTGGLKW